MNTNYPNSEKNTRQERYSRTFIHETISVFSQYQGSERSFAELHDIPYPTLQYWSSRISDGDPTALFFESAAGLECLHRIVLAVRFLITLFCGGGVRVLSLFLRLSQLDRYVAASTGSQYQAQAEMEQAIGSFEDEQKPELIKDMKPKDISLAEDETFHPQTCLVGMEPVSNFIILEKYVEKRDTATWNDELSKALDGLPVRVLQSTSDEGRALLSHVRDGLGVHHAPDLFHVQHELQKATSYPLHSQLRRKKEAFEQGKATEEEVKEAESRVEQAKEAIRGISNGYHLVNPETGKLQGSDTVETTLSEHFQSIETIAVEAGLGEKSEKRIAKARRVVPKMKETIAFVYQLIVNRVFALQLPDSVVQAIFQHLVPGMYLQKLAKQAGEAERRNELREQANERLANWERDGPADRQELEEMAKEWVMLFVRTSSMVEGRNSHLRQRHRSLHRLSARTLRALTVVHNYFIQREDGTTAAERFFGQKHEDLFEYLVNNVEVPRRPAKKRISTV